MQEKRRTDPVGSYRNLVHAVALGVGDDGERLLRQYGEKVIEYHGISGQEEKDKFKEEVITPLLDKIGEAEKTNHKIGDAVVAIVFAESILN